MNLSKEDLYLIIGVVYGMFELLVRFVPTSHNWSILTILMKIIKELIPNNAKVGGSHDDTRSS